MQQILPNRPLAPNFGSVRTLKQFHIPPALGARGPDVSQPLIDLVIVHQFSKVIRVRAFSLQSQSLLLAPVALDRVLPRHYRN
ncbi:MAG: hypothetical protein RLZZ511_284 [Cyanobacteriota bacterium]